MLPTDVVMPGLSGERVAENVKTLRPDIRVLFMSGYVNRLAEGARSLPKGAQVLPKPFTVEAPRAGIAQVLTTARKPGDRSVARQSYRS